ncbi:hypothetical protein FNV43_RR25498 [Rhamnella rubrinervis]|uniref:Uncharacterized protein n=1 Tax=Rhamnella rubrinervis TaxID=2594499 RepID=A0A8K0GU78_9ROSA|nr:hypothetical protein FNV43_RR25498 [Rhamnella rubrinervis]
MKFIVRSCYKLDPIEIENDGDVKYTPPLQKTTAVGERDSDPAIPFASRSGSNRLSTSIPIVDVNVNGSGIGNEDYSIPRNEIEENIAFNLNNEDDITIGDRVLPTIDEYDRLYNLYNYDLECDDDTNAVMQEDDIALDDDIEVNGTFEVSIEANCDAHFVRRWPAYYSVGC